MPNHKWFGFTVLLATIVLLLASGAYCADVAKIGVIDFQKIFEKSEAGKTIKREINQQGRRMEKDLKFRGSQIEALKKQLEREAMVMSREKREQKEREFRIKINDLKSLKQKYEKEIQQLQKRLINRVRRQVLNIVEEIGKKEGYLLIVEQIGVVYAPQSVNLTDRIIQIYNERYKKQRTKKSSK